MISETNKTNLADMHTHSENSHDSVCKIEDMAVAQMNCGTNIFAVTDHFDTYSFDDYDIFTPIKKAHETVIELNERLNNKCQILSGIEISEGFWFPNVYNKVTNLIEFDIILGSVHLVRYKDMRKAYSCIDFSKCSKETIYEYLDTYFDDVITLLDTTDFDVLTHLTCPLRYITGKYKIDVDITRYYKKIERILNRIIKSKIALEVNTSSYCMLNSFMPPYDVLRMYRDLGGYLITLGSDAHQIENASINFDLAKETLKELGFKSVYYYVNRNPYQILI